MNDLNLNRKYAPMSITLHWLTLALMIAVYVSIELHEAIPRGNPWRGTTEHWHIYFGFLILILAVIRLAISLRSTPPPITPTPPNWQMLVTKGMKVYLYALMLIMPFLGWWYLSANDEAINFFFIPLPAISPVSESMAEFAKEAHEIFGVSGYYFIGIHAAAALYHHYLVKDDTLRRMLPSFLSR